MELIEHRCKRCGGELNEIDGGKMKCPYCACTYDRAVAEKNTRTLRDEFDDIKREVVYNLRRNLYDAVNEEYISSEKVRDYALELKKYIPDDFAACFYEIAVGNNVRQLTKFIRKINVEENYSEIDTVIRFLIKSLQTEYLLELNNLVERAYKQRNLALFEKYSTEISLEAEKVESGVYEVKMPRDAFIAYSSKDMDTVSELCEVLEGQGLKCFVAARNLRHGKGSVENYDKLLCEAMDHCKSFIFVSSANSRNFSCDALTKELPYIQQKDIENAPAEHKNNYAAMPHKYKKPRVEYRIEESHGFNAADAISNEFFDGYERVYSPEAVAERVVKQLLVAAEKKETKKPAPAPTPAPGIVQATPTDLGGQRSEPLLKRASIFIDDGEWDDATTYCEKALDIDPENSQAYVLKLMIDLKVKKQNDLASYSNPFDNNRNFKKAIKYGDSQTAETLNGYIKAINERNEHNRLQGKYDAAIANMQRNNIEGYEQAISIFGEIPSFLDSKAKIEQCRDAIESIKETNKINWNNEQYLKAVTFILNGNENNNIKSFESALILLKSIKGWKDADIKITECEKKIEDLKVLAAETNRLQAIEFENNRKKKLRILLISLVSIVVFIVAFISIRHFVIIPTQYDKAIELIADGEYTEALELLEQLPKGYKDSEEKQIYCYFALEKYNELRDYIDENSIKEFTVPDGVTSIGESAFKDCISLTSITIPDSVTSIGSSAFDGCKSLASIEIPDTVMSISDYAFYDCTSLTSITIPDSVTSIGSSAFAGCISLESVMIGNDVTSIGVSAFYGCTSLDGVYISDLAKWCKINYSNYSANPLYYAYKLYLNGKLVTDLVIPSGVTNISDYAFNGCTCFTSISIPDSVTSIGSSAFDGCKSLASIEIPDSVTSIGSSAFAGCTSLESVMIGNDVTSIGDSAFYGCTSLDGVYISDLAKWCKINYSNYSANPLYYAYKLYLNGELVTDLVIPSGVTNIGNYAFNGYTYLTSITIPDGVMSIGNYAFNGCTSLTSITIPDSVMSIGHSAFDGCTNIENATMPTLAISHIHKNNLETVVITCGEIIGDSAFYGCTSLENVTIGNGVSTIGDAAFKGCTNITSIEIPDSVTIVGSSAFDGCTRLANVTLGNGVTTIGFSAFKDCTNITSIEIPDSVTIIGSSAFSNCVGLTNVTIDNSAVFVTENSFYGCTNIENIRIPAFAIAFIPKNNLKTVVITSGDSIADSAFAGCSGLTSIEIPDTVTSIGDFAFLDCTGLTRIELPDTLTSVGDSAFAGCTSLTSIEIPDSVTSIGNYAFYNCYSLTSVVIPDSVTSIGGSAFYSCDRLTSVTFKNPNGWWRASSSDATSGTSISSSSLADVGIAAKYLKYTYRQDYWKRS